MLKINVVLALILTLNAIIVASLDVVHVTMIGF